MFLFWYVSSTCTIKIFLGGGKVGGWVNSERCLKWGGGGVIKESQLKLLKRGWVKAEIVRRGNRGLERVTIRKILIVHYSTEGTNGSVNLKYNIKIPGSTYHLGPSCEMKMNDLKY